MTVALENIAPGTVRDLSSWPAPLLPIVQALGVDAVWQMGLKTLGYPPTWAQTEKETSRVLRAADMHHMTRKE